MRTHAPSEGQLLCDGVPSLNDDKSSTQNICAAMCHYSKVRPRKVLCLLDRARDRSLDSTASAFAECGSGKWMG